MSHSRQNEAVEELVQEPEPAYLHDELGRGVHDIRGSDDEREATELRQISVDKNALPRLSHVMSPGKSRTGWYEPVRKIWRHHIRVTVPHEDCRDHLANERTFLGFLRTSIMLSVTGVLFAQLDRLQHAPGPSNVFGYFILGKSIPAVFQSAALCTIMLGCIRFYRQQSAMALGMVHAGGWEINTIIAGSFLLLLALFALHVGVETFKIVHPAG